MNKGPQKTMVEAILSVSHQIKNDRTESDVLMKAMEELGELALEVAVHAGRSYKEPGKDGVVGEAIDVINCMVDLIYTHNPNITEQELAKIAYTKQLKWLKHYQESQPQNI